MSTLIIPSAGKSTRFPNTKPKWMLTHPKTGNMMIIESIRGLELDKFNCIYVGLLKSHLDDYNCREGLYEQFKEIGIYDKTEIVEIDEETKSQPETICKIITLKNINDSIFIKDCDDYFEAEYTDQNKICTYNLSSMKNVTAGSKSYVSTDDLGYVTNIAEKKIISDTFCCGGYSFKSSIQYLNTYNSLSDIDNLYTSHIILNMMLLENENFKVINCENYADWGTETDWLIYISKFKTYFIDLDGVLVKNSAEFTPPYWGDTDSLSENVKTMNEIYDMGYSTVIITTSRKEKYKEKTILQLKNIGMKYDRIIFGLPHGNRTIINDYSTSNPYPSCIAINLQRNVDSLKNILK